MNNSHRSVETRRTEIKHLSKVLAAAMALITMGCEGNAQAEMSGPGVANVTIADWQWRIDGNCITEGNDVTFTGLGDPMLSIGFSISGTAAAVGNLSSQKEGFIILIGTDEAPKPTVTIADNAYSVTGAFSVPGETLIDGAITVTCD